VHQAEQLETQHKNGDRGHGDGACDIGECTPVSPIAP
jgi:hypothetical protein